MRESKAREFFFEYKEDSNEFGQLSTSPIKMIEKGFEAIHVIEFEAYRKAVEALKEIAKHSCFCSIDDEIIPQVKARETLRELGVE